MVNGQDRAKHALVTLMGPGALRRLGLALAICTLVSTQALFQPTLYQPVLPGPLFDTWLDYFGECALMTVPILIGASLAELGSRNAGTPLRLALTLLAIALSACIGALLLFPYYGLEVRMDRRFVSDVLFWTALSGGVAMIYALQERAAQAATLLHRTQLEGIALSQQMTEVRLQVLRAQIEPHFLFNTLANVKRLCQTNLGDGLSMLDNLTRYLRAALPRLRDAQSTVGQEAELVAAYLAVLQIRMGERLRYDVVVPSNAREVPFPPMMLLTLVENAIKHGLTPVPEGGSLFVHVNRESDALAASVADTGVGFGVAPTSGTGVGLANTRARLAAMFGDRASLEFEANRPHGVVATVRIPLVA